MARMSRIGFKSQLISCFVNMLIHNMCWIRVNNNWITSTLRQCMEIRLKSVNHAALPQSRPGHAAPPDISLKSPKNVFYVRADVLTKRKKNVYHLHTQNECFPILRVCILQNIITLYERTVCNTKWVTSWPMELDAVFLYVFLSTSKTIFRQYEFLKLAIQSSVFQREKKY